MYNEVCGKFSERRQMPEKFVYETSSLGIAWLELEIKPIYALKITQIQTHNQTKISQSP